MSPRLPGLPGRSGRTPRPDLPVAPGERLLAWATTADGRAIGGTRDAAYLPERLPWDQVQAADWDRETGLLHVAEVGSWGEERVVHELGVEEPGRFLELLRERVTSTVVLQRQVPITSRRGVRIVARRATSGERTIRWVVEYDEGVDPDDPLVGLATREALDAAQEELSGL